MNIKDIARTVPRHYLAMFRVFLQPDGGLLIIAGNVLVGLSPDEVQGLLHGKLDFTEALARLHEQINNTVLSILQENGHAEAVI